ncbi:MAG: IS66 family insertion sequence element accessory protein TnpB [Limosilactobacillus sp.]|jgi:transposase|uniref:IS66 family insertion sequence element accessory protein TnpB n=1 Tax=Limosilactobacillus sp. TaxID=2773925 RepID=UPI0025C7025D|nr:IS66 family insertion sequence element accessory protein TnpB [Limosilactobacillus sp.]MCI1975538.1 IS66 family insertion sequence element accessory protein TnpB [Limosilactobacillus sp.]
MLINWQDPDKVYLVCGKTDLRKGIDGLAIVVAENYGLELYDQSLLLFCGSRNDRFKALFWDGEGFILLYKRFENGHLKWPRNSLEAKQLSSAQLTALLKGLNPFPTPRIHSALPGNLY